MLVALIAKDKPGALQIRLDNRAAHLEHIESSGLVLQAGPFLDGEGTMCGSLVILNVETMDQARAWADGDPYARAGLFEDVELRPWNKVVG
ncbi:YciI family protein [Tropicimonas sp.]|uniref:YciI family protein n=1 Tax=Tropicimonas sp. TaxID=2067044 RepID=UPI003A84DC46